MASLRKASAYSKKKVTPFTRTSKRRQKSYIKTVPPQKIVKFEMGQSENFHNGKLPHIIDVSSSENVQIRHNALEACRQYINKKLEKEMNGQYFFKVIPYPHHIQRENKMLTGAGADRMQTGMQLSFGKTVSKATITKKGSTIFLIALPTRKAASFTRKVIKQVNPKLPGKIRIDYRNLDDPKAR
jgi:large subunit ribosomal protein L10e